jgi:hypothetical protein
LRAGLTWRCDSVVALDGMQREALKQADGVFSDIDEQRQFLIVDVADEGEIRRRWYIYDIANETFFAGVLVNKEYVRSSDYQIIKIQ